MKGQRHRITGTAVEGYFLVLNVDVDCRVVGVLLHGVDFDAIEHHSRPIEHGKVEIVCQRSLRFHEPFFLGYGSDLGIPHKHQEILAGLFGFLQDDHVALNAIGLDDDLVRLHKILRAH